MTAVFWIILALAVFYLALTFCIFQIASRRFTGSWDPLRPLTHATDAILGPYRDLIESGQAWLKNAPSRNVSLQSYDGLKLAASYYEHPKAKGVLIACHGYRSDGVRDFASACRFYSEHDLSILLIDQRAAGRSEGKYITFGVRESRDVRSWCEYVRDLCPGLPVLLAGISMGASSVLMASDDLPDNVAAVLADCGYDRPLEEILYVARHFVAPPAVILVPGVGLWCRLIGGYGLREKSASDSLSRCRLPVFFVHGEADDFVPFENSPKNRAACAGPTAFFSVPGAGHGLSYLVDTEGYCSAVNDFLKTVLPPD